MSITSSLAARVATLFLVVALVGPLAPSSAAMVPAPVTPRAPSQRLPLLRIDVSAQGDRAELNYAVWGFKVSAWQVDAICAASATAVYRREGDRETANLALAGALRLKTDLSHQKRRLGEVELWLQPGHLPRQGNLVSDSFSGARLSLNLRW